MTADIRQTLRQWIVEKRKLVDPAQIANDTALLDGGFLRSIDVADLLIFIEFLRERPVDITDMKPGVFASIDSIANQFFPADAS